MENNEFMNLVKQRTSCRSYLTKDVDDEQIKFCLEAAQLAPSACNRQPWRFIIVKDNELRNEISKKCLLPGIPMPWLANAPVIVALCAAKELLTHRLFSSISGVNYHLIDCGIAGEHFVLAAESLGLGTCWIGWFKKKRVKKLLNIPNSFEPISLLSLGYPDKKTEPRSRLPLDKIAHYDRWS